MDIENDYTPDDLDELRVRLARRAADFDQTWRHCDAQACHRARRCAADPMICARPPGVRDPDAEATAIAELHQALKAEMARRDMCD